MQSRRERRRALVIDDDADHRELVCNLLERMGVETHAAESAVEAMQTMLAARRRYQMVVTDVTMPKLSGLDLMLLLRKAGETVPFVVVSGVDEAEIAKVLAAVGHAIHIRKPMRVSVFETAVRSFMWPT